MITTKSTGAASSTSHTSASSRAGNRKEFKLKVKTQTVASSASHAGTNSVDSVDHDDGDDEVCSVDYPVNFVA